MTTMPSVREQVTRTIRVAIPLPCDNKTFGLWQHRSIQEFKARKGREPKFDNDFEISSDGDELVASFDVTTEAGAA